LSEISPAGPGVSPRERRGFVRPLSEENLRFSTVNTPERWPAAFFVVGSLLGVPRWCRADGH
jgi:hypothetical protein